MTAPCISGFDRKYVGGANYRYRYRLLRLQYTLETILSRFIFDSFAIVAVFRLSFGFSDTQSLRSNDQIVVHFQKYGFRVPTEIFCADPWFNPF